MNALKVKRNLAQMQEVLPSIKYPDNPFVDELQVMALGALRAPPRAPKSLPGTLYSDYRVFYELNILPPTG